MNWTRSKIQPLGRWDLAVDLSHGVKEKERLDNIKLNNCSHKSDFKEGGKGGLIKTKEQVLRSRANGVRATVDEKL